MSDHDTPAGLRFGAPARREAERHDEPRARLARSLSNATLAAEMDAAREAGTLVNAWTLTDGREVLALRGKIAVALPDGRIQRADWPAGCSARLVVVALLTEPVESMGGLIDG